MLLPVVDAFLREGLYLRDWTVRTHGSYRQALTRFVADHGDALPTRASLNAYVIALRERGVSPGGVNMYARTVNAFLSWLHEQEHLPAPLRIKLLPNPPKVIPFFTDKQLRVLVAHRPRRRGEQRTLTLTLLLLDTGLRIEEALSLRSADINFDDLLLKVLGKGRKERLVPFSLEMRKWLYRLTQRQPAPYVFHSYTGQRLAYASSGSARLRRSCLSHRSTSYETWWSTRTGFTTTPTLPGRPSM